MKLALLLDQIAPVPPGLHELEIAGVREDSRLVQPGDCFVAVPGLTVDGHDFAAGAVAAGAALVVAERPLELAAPCLIVPDAARALGLLAARLQGEPARQLQLLGVTGTNGKTTTTTLMESILIAAGQQPGVIGTVTYRYAGRSEAAPFTTPTAPVLQALLRRMVDAGCTHLVAEISSHALQLGRVWGLQLGVAGFTHLTQDHLDLHGSMEAYLAAKLLLFQRHLRPGGTAVVNMDGGGAEQVVQAVRERGDLKLLRCSSGGRPAEACLLEVSSSIEGLRGQLRLGASELEISSPLIGAYNADNILMAAACCHAAGIPDRSIVTGIAALRGVPGRLERVEHQGGDFAVLVDYAHTPDALERAIGVLRPLCRGRLIVVFGCGGDRDRSKRPLMGAAVARGADLALVTSDNPRTEEPLSIIEGILGGVSQEAIPRLEALGEAERGYLVEADRRRAIQLAAAACRPGDILLIAGKGHEDYQILGRQKIHFDDREVAAEALRVPA